MSDSNAKQIYMREISHTRAMSKEEQLKSFNNFHGEGLVESCLFQVVAVAKRFMERIKTPTSFDLNDLIQEGNVGLFEALEKFDPSFNTKFSTYAHYWVYSKIQKFIEKQTKFADLVLSLDYVVDLNGTEVKFSDTVADNCRTSEEILESKDDYNALFDKISELNNADQENVIKMRYGFGCDRMTQTEIGKIIGKSKQRIEQIEKKALTRLKKLVKI